ncbi:hypothetical protein SHKM778_06730 [Streptomyces sp. KM77-8]|uniref:Cell division protein FtsK n=1 Tax=Streptomyces haneummycinicus TaxID=3074435 RepID=A0AAT9HAA4_9ACTN
MAGGPDSGRVVRLGAGAATAGSAPTCSLPLTDTTLPPVALRITIDIKGGTTLAPEGGADLLLDDRPVTSGTPWPPSGVVRAGDSLLVLDRVAEPDAHLSAMSEGGLAYNRPPRLSPLRPRRRLVVPVPPTKGDRARFQFIMAFMPMLFGIGMWLLTQQIYMLLFCLMSPMMMAAQWLSENREGKKQHKTSVKQYKKDIAAHTAELAALGKEEQRARRADSPDPAEILLFATGPRRRLWERRLTDPDALHLRIGSGSLPSDVELVLGRGGSLYEEERPEPPVLPDVPVTLPFSELGVIGVAGDRARALATARWLAVQAAVLHSPRDLSS